MSDNFLTGRDIVCVSTTDWDEIWGSRQQIMSELATSNRVFYVEKQVGPEHLARYPKLRGRWNGGDERSAGGVTLLRPPLMAPGRFYSRTADDLSQRRLVSWLRGKLASLGAREPILWIYPPNSHLLPGSFGESHSVYHCIDRFAGQSAGRKRRIILEEERDLLRRVDVCLGYSRAVYDLHRSVCPRTRYWPNGCDYERIRATIERDAPEPEDLAAIPHPRLGHMGSIAGKTDLELIDALSRNHPEWHLVFVGAEYPLDLDMERWRRLKTRPNVHHLGAKPIADVPAYEKGFDACLMLWKVNDWTRELQPIKIFEYLATGIGIVSTDLPELSYLGEGMVFARTYGEYEAACGAIVRGEHAISREAQLALAERYAWKKRLAEAADILAIADCGSRIVRDSNK